MSNSKDNKDLIDDETLVKDTLIMFRESELIKVKLKNKTKEDNLDQSKFLKACVRAYLADDPKFMEWMNHFLERKKKLRPHERQARKQLEKEVEEIVANFNLEDQEVDTIFDLTEKEFPDL